MPKCDKCLVEKPVVTPVKEEYGGNWCDDCINTYEELKGVKIGHCSRCGKEKVQTYVGSKFYCPDSECWPDRPREAPDPAKDAPKSIPEADLEYEFFQKVMPFLVKQHLDNRQNIATVMFASRMICDSIDMHAIGAAPRREKAGYTPPEKLAAQAVRDADLLLEALKKAPNKDEEEEPDADGKVPKDRH